MSAAGTIYETADLAAIYDLENGWGADFDFCAGLAADAGSVLDLGCGTGALAAALAKGRYVVGIEPAIAMLDRARARPGGEGVTWIEGDARSVRLGTRFDLVVMTGHTFQAFLTDDDQAAVLATIAAHLSPGGRFVFDTRNPALRHWEGRYPDNTLRRLVHPQLGPVEMRSAPNYAPETQILTSTHTYDLIDSGRTLTSTLQLRYTDRDDLARRIAAAGLSVQTWLGDWHGQPFEDGSKDIIPLGRLA